MTDYAFGAGPALGPALVQTDAEAALASWLAPYTASKSAFLLQAQPAGGDPRYPYAKHDTPADAAAGLGAMCEVTERASGRILVPANIVHPPVRVLDPDTGRYVYQYAQAGVGALISKSILSSSGVEINNVPLFRPGTGFTFAAKFRTPVPSSSLHGVAYGATVGGALLGGDSATNTNDPVFSINQTNGLFYAEQKRGTVIFSSRADLRDGQEHLVICSINVQAETVNGWVDPANSGAAAYSNGASGNPVTDFAVASDPVDAAFGSPATNLNYVGEVSAILGVAAPLGDIPAFRDALIGYLNTVA